MLMLVGTALPPAARRRRRAAHHAEARRPAQLRRGAAVGAALHLTPAWPTTRSCPRAFARTARAPPAARPTSCASMPDHRRSLRHRAWRADLRRRRWRASRRCARATPPPATATATVSGCCWRTGPTFFLHWFALNALGVSVVPINADLRAAELRYLVGPQRARAGREPAAAHRRPARRGRAAGRMPVLLAIGDAGAVAAAPWPAPQARRRRSTRDSECALLYTSGTTGRPKGCMLQQRLLPACRASGTRGIGGLCALRAGEERVITPLPLTHMNAMAYSTMAMLHDRRLPGAARSLPPRQLVAVSVRESRATIVHYLGVMPAMLLGAPPSPDDREHAVRFGFGAGVDRRAARAVRSSASAFRCSRPGP